MPPFTVNPNRFDPYKSFKFQIIVEGRIVSGLTKVSGLRRETAVVASRAGDERSAPRLSPGPSRYEPITLERGLTHDTTFEDWANDCWNASGGLGSEVRLSEFRKDFIIRLLNEAGQIVLAYKVYRAWISRYQALPDLDANGCGVAIESITIEHEGWERDAEVAEPEQP